MSTEEISVQCPVCGKEHVFQKDVQEFRCRGKHLVLLSDRHGWRLMEVRKISEKDDRELDKIWGSSED